MDDLDRQIEQLRRCEYIKESEVRDLCNLAKEILIEEPNIQQIYSPITVSNSFFQVELITINFCLTHVWYCSRSVVTFMVNSTTWWSSLELGMTVLGPTTFSWVTLLTVDSTQSKPSFFCLHWKSAIHRTSLWSEEITSLARSPRSTASMMSVYASMAVWMSGATAQKLWTSSL